MKYLKTIRDRVRKVVTKLKRGLHLMQNSDGVMAADPEQNPSHGKAACISDEHTQGKPRDTVLLDDNIFALKLELAEKLGCEVWDISQVSDLYNGGLTALTYQS